MMFSLILFFQVLNLHSCVKVAEDFVSPEVRQLFSVVCKDKQGTETYLLTGLIYSKL